jgi:nucleoid DNA-binding protein
MTKKEIAKSINDEYGIGIENSRAVVQRVIDALATTIITEGRLELRNFGVFLVKDRKEYIARNPLTNTSVHVKGGKRVWFKMGKGMRDKLYEGDKEVE